MKYIEKNFKRQRKLLRDCAKFLCSKDRVPSVYASQDGELWLSWWKKEQKHLKRFAKRFECRYYPVSLRAMFIMSQFYILAQSIEYKAKRAYENAYNGDEFDSELGELSDELSAFHEEVLALMKKIAKECRDFSVKYFVISKLDDEDTLWSLAGYSNRIVRRLAKIRLKQIDPDSELELKPA